MKKKISFASAKLFFLLLIAFCTTNIFAQNNANFYNIKDIVSFDIAEKLNAESRVIDIHGKDDKDFNLLPKSKYIANVNENVPEKENGYIIECLYLVDKSTLIENSSNDKTKVDTSINAVSKILRSISKMEGLKYISSITNEERVLYKRTYMMEGPEDDTPIADKNDGNADGQTSYVYQHDRLFGGCKYQINYFQSENELYMQFRNITDMKFGLIKAVTKNNFRANLIVMDCGEQYLVYVVGNAGCKRIALINREINNAFYGRLNALYSWFIKQF